MSRFDPSTFKRTEFAYGALDEAAIVATTDTRGRIVYVNEKFCTLSGYSSGELIGSNHRILKSGIHSEDFFRDMYRTIAQGFTWHGELCNKAKDGSIYWVDTTIVPRRNENSRIEYYDAIRFDITPLKNAEEKLWIQAHTDALTGLPNRTVFSERLNLLVRGTSCQTAVAVLDVDEFKDVNDSFGHDVGDQLLKEIAGRLKTATRQDSNVTVARIGGDEFAVVMPGSEVGPDFDQRLSSIIEAIREPFEFSQFSLRCTVSIGVAIYPDDGSTPTELTKNADIALYQAKASGRDCYRLFLPEMASCVFARGELRRQAEASLRSGDFELYFQPIIDISSRAPEICGFEALLRWHHQILGFITPSSFSEIFDDPSLSRAIGDHVLELAMQHMRAWLAAQVPFQRISINVTDADFSGRESVRSMLRRLKTADLETKLFSIEVTEGMFLGRGHNRITQALGDLHAAGVEIALDDFGTGYASLAHLTSLPIHRLKIDRTFVTDLRSNPKINSIVDGIIRIAHSLNLKVTAEGVETDEQLMCLINLGCDHAQGYLYARPMPGNEVPSYIAHILQVSR